MINVVVSGCNGAMGRVLTKAIEEMEDMTIVAGIDKNINSYKNKDVVSLDHNTTSSSNFNFTYHLIFYYTKI